jgi:acetyltransferase
VTLGLGGVFTDVLKDVSFRLAPVTPSVARGMIEELAGYAVLAGARARPPADMDALVDAIVRLSALALDLEDRVAALEINPLFVFPAGRGVVAAEALIKLRPSFKE